MEVRSVLGSVFAASLLFASPAKASTVTDDFSGTLGGNPVSGSISLDVVGGQAVDGTGTFTGFGFANVPLVLITPSTPGDEGAPSSVGFRANDGTDYFGANTNVPIDATGLLFDVDTATAAFGQFPLFNLASGTNDSAFTGNVGGTEFYNQVGTVDLTATPLPAALPMFVGGLGLVGLLSARRRKSKKQPSLLLVSR
jgi:hypothetical protein